jgi:tRNA modification GTPase
MNLKHISSKDTICALATPPGIGAIAIIRLSGADAFNICEKVFVPNGKIKHMDEMHSHTLHLGAFFDNLDLVDEVLISVFRHPASYTAEDVIEISCHGSMYIQKKIIEVLLANGARMADPGEFTIRAFLNSKFDLSEAEAVADLIASNSKSSHELAIEQMRGGFSSKIRWLRTRLLEFISLIELELDFSEEDVQFADRTSLIKLLSDIKDEVVRLKSSFALGNVLKYGIPVAIVGKPNVGKSTLLNALLNEERAIVSDIPGTTRDTIEDTINIEGINFRFIDTAGLRHSIDSIEKMGIGRTYEKISQASVVLYVFDINETTEDDIDEAIEDIRNQVNIPDKEIILVANKTDMLQESPHTFRKLVDMDTLFVSAKRLENINLITNRLLNSVQLGEAGDKTIVSNLRHYDALTQTLESIMNVEKGFEDCISSDLIAIDIRQALYHLGLITGEITSDEILGSIFGKFCIGK